MDNTLKKFRNLFAFPSEPEISIVPNRATYPFLYYSKDTKYIPLPFFSQPEDVAPIVIKNSWGGRPYYKDYLAQFHMIKGFNTYHLTRVQTRGGTLYAIGDHCMYHMRNMNSTRIIPIFVMCFPSAMYEGEDRQTLVHEKKHYFEVFFNNNIRAVNTTVWDYIRKYYIPALQLEGLRFQFLNPDQIMDLATASLTPPKFKSMEQVQRYKDKLSDSVSLEPVLEDL